MRRRTTTALAALAAAAALAGCGGEETAEPAAPATTEAPTTEAATTEAATTEAATTDAATTEAATTEAATTEQAATEAEDRPDVDVHVEVAGGERAGGPARVEAAKGDHVRIEIAVDAPQEFHLHGYELSREATPAKPAVFDFEAELEGIFELESHASEEVVVNVVVEP